MSLQILVGPMFAGKSSAILRIVNRYQAIHWPICCITYVGDTRYSAEDVLVNHDEMSVPCIKVKTLSETINTDEFQKAKLVIVDEAQFFGDLREFVLYTVDKLGKDLVIVGLDGDADRRPFGQILECMPLADEITKLKAFCQICLDGTEALFTYCKQQKAEQVCVGGAEMYMPLCRKCYNKHSSIAATTT